jgi:hypothetical protein
MSTWVLSLLACEPQHSPEWVATQACAVVPGLQLESAAQAMGAEALHPDELRIWHDDGEYGTASYARQPYGRVIQTVGLEGLGVIRANSLCTLRDITWDDAGGAGTATLTRSEPELLALSAWDVEAIVEQPRVERQVVLDLVHTEQGWRALTGLAAARDEADAAEALALQGDFAGAHQGYLALHSRFPDPRILLRMDQLRGEALVLEAQALSYLQVVDESLYYVNGGLVELPRGRLNLRCGDVTVGQDHPSIRRGERWWVGLPELADPALCEKAD